MLINDLENDENIEQFDFDLFNSSQDNPNDKLITNDEVLLDKLGCDQDTNNNETNSTANSFYQETNQVTDRFSIFCSFRSGPCLAPSFVPLFKPPNLCSI